MVRITPIIAFLNSDDWESDSDLSEVETESESVDSAVFLIDKIDFPSVEAQYEPTPESLEERRLFLKNDLCRKKLCQDCSKRAERKTSNYTGRDPIEHCTTSSFEGKEDDFRRHSKYIKDRKETYQESEMPEKLEEMKLNLGRMKPAKPFVRKELYKGISHDGKGKAKYLSMRYCELPEDRWHLPVCTSMEYGWNWGHPPEIEQPKYGRKSVIIPSIFRPNDTQLKPRDITY